MTERSLLNEAGGGGASGRTFKIFLPEQRSVAQLKSIVGDASVQVEESIDENLIGGFVLRIGDLEFNASVSNKLQKLKREFVYNPYIKEY